MKFPLSLFAVSVLFLSCIHADIPKEKQRLLAAYKEERKARLLGDFEYLSEAQTDSLIFMHDGRTETLTKQQTKDSLLTFFKRAQYDVWEDMQAPVVNISPDGSMAWIHSKIAVRTTRQNTQGTVTQEQFTFIALTTYAKSDGRWLKSAEALTITPK